MAEKKETVASSDKNLKIAATIMIVLVVVLAGTLFAFQQDKNKDDKAANTDTPSENTQENVATPETAPVSSGEDAGALGKNEVKLTDANFKQEVEDYKGVVLADFYLSTCPHCQNVAKDVTAVSDELAGKVKVGKMDARENRTTSDKFSIEGVPTFIVFKDGQQVEKVSGERTKEQLLDMVNKYLK